ncbi:hypothetical protein [Bifidobacterium simiiventris]|uniref:hypothetical protein n=1 Tax=Bifidobacterium simiiventris TaxID=2834434 RepID=UPI001C598C93|nr:hypothetical protein [Bifidobacterium simiiventris]MBW3077704.1 hypothetical protein [Bifidobacterium simiiventris]
MTEHQHDPQTRFDADLRSLKTGYQPLHDIAMRRATVIHDTGGHGTRSTAPVPMNLGAWQLMQDIDKLTLTMTRAAGLHAHHAMDTVDLLAGVIRNQGRLVVRRDFPALAELVDQAAVRLDRMLDPPPDTKMIGWCPDCGCELRCDPLELQSGYKACDQCRAEHRIKDIHRSSMAMVAVGGARGTASSISRLLAPWGIDVKANTISHWGARDVIHAVAVDEAGSPVFLVWDVWQALNRSGRGRKAM